MPDLSWNDLVPSLLQLTLVIAKTILNIAVVLAVGYAGLRLVNRARAFGTFHRTVRCGAPDPHQDQAARPMDCRARVPSAT